MVIKGFDREQLISEEKEEWLKLTVEEHMEYYMKQGIEKKEAMKLVAKDRGVSKRDIYNMTIN